jgi:hypothetical protein
MQRFKVVRLSPSEETSLKRLDAGAPHSSISSVHFDRFKKLMLIERHGLAWKLTPLGLHQLQGIPKPVPITRADPLALLESIVTKHHAVREHRELARARQSAARSTGPRRP